MNKHSQYVFKIIYNMLGSLQNGKDKFELSNEEYDAVTSAYSCLYPVGVKLNKK